MGVLVAFGYLFPESKLMLLFLPFPIKAKYFIPGIILLDLFSAVTGAARFRQQEILPTSRSHQGGALTGMLRMHYRRKQRHHLMQLYRWN